MANMQVRNNINLIGNLGAAPVVRTTDAGLTITEFRLATNETFRDKNGTRQTRTDWHTVKAFGKLAETFAQYLEQGSQVCIAGALRYNKWIDKHDQVRVSAEVIAHSFTFLSGGKSRNSDSTLAIMDELENDQLVAEPAASTSRKGSAKKVTTKQAGVKKRSAKKTPAKVSATAGDDLPF